MDPSFLENSDYDLWRLLSYTFRRLSYTRAKQLHKYGLSHEVVATLWAVQYLDNNAMPIEIAREAMRKPQTITAILNRMIKKGLLVKTRDELKKNIFRVSLTEKGQKAYENSQKIQIYHKAMSSLSAEQRKQFKECLEEILKNIS